MHDLMLESSRPATGTLSVKSPFDGRELDQIATAGPDHVDDAMSTAHGIVNLSPAPSDSVDENDCGRLSWLPVSS